MQQKHRHILFVLLLLLCSYSVTLAQTVPTIKVEGEVTHPLSLTGQDLAAMKRTEVSATDRDGKEHHYTGVALADILQQAGATIGSQLRGENMAKYLLVKSSDGYEVVFSLPELDTAFTNRIVILADQQDGQPLPQGKGPWRIVVPGEKRPARWIWQVSTMVVRFAKE